MSRGWRGVWVEEDVEWVKDGGLYGWRDVCVEVGSGVEVGRVCGWRDAWAQWRNE